MRVAATEKPYADVFVTAYKTPGSVNTFVSQ
jgi:hypothetical protein